MHHKFSERNNRLLADYLDLSLSLLVPATLPPIPRPVRPDAPGQIRYPPPPPQPHIPPGTSTLSLHPPPLLLRSDPHALYPNSPLSRVQTPEGVSIWDRT